MNHLFIILVLAATLSGCGFKEDKNPSAGNVTAATGSTGTNPGSGTSPTNGGTTTLTATYSSIASQIFQPKCVGCHSGFATYSGVMGSVIAV